MKDAEFERKLSTLNEVKITGDALIQNINYSKTNKNVDDFQNAKVRIGFSAKPSDKVETEFRYIALDKDFDSNSKQRMQPINRNGNKEYNGTARSTFGRTQGSNDVEVAKVKVNKIFNDTDSIQVGRSFMTHGHGMVINDYADAVTYKTQAGDVTLSGSAIYANYADGLERDNNNDPIANRKGRQIWNINADVNVKGNNIYAGVYHQDTKDYYDYNDLNPLDQNLYLTHKDRIKDVVELGSSGNVTSDGKIRYDVAFVASTNERSNVANGGRKDRATGYMEHVSLDWDASPDLTAKLAYTTADKDFDGIISLDKNQGSYDGTTTPFDDIARFQNLLGGMHNDKFYNTSDFKLQLQLALANNQSLRFAYDIVKENHDIVKSGYTPNGANATNWNVAGFNKLDTKISTLEYKYQFDPSTRFSMGITNADNSKSRDEFDQKMKDEQLFWTEIFSKF